MKAVLCHEFTGPAALSVGEAPPPPLGEDEVRISVKCASVSFMDTLLVSGLYQMKPPLPFVPGTDAAGEVVEIGAKVTRFKPGDRVAAFGWTGAFAEQMVVKDLRAIMLPDALDYERGAAIMHCYVTALYSLRERGALAKGETLLVHGAAGGVGLAAVDLGRHLGARVIATVGADEKAAVVKQYGAEEVINYTAGDFRERVRELTGGRGADVIYDPVGGDVFDQSVRCIAWNGRLLVIGFASGRIPELPANRVLLNNFSVVGVMTGVWADRFPQENVRVSDEVMALAASGAINPLVTQTLPMEKAGDAMQAIVARGVTGRIVLKIA